MYILRTYAPYWGLLYLGAQATEIGANQANVGTAGQVGRYVRAGKYSVFRTSWQETLLGSME